ncbi:MAG: transcription termination factor Rho, partial [Patescibacteria group bacterium]|nr:transcription termination factor Rho [Patescibacteria group bacterium]
ELHLDRKLAERRIFPAIDVGRSGTRQDELLFGMEKIRKVNTLRRMIDLMNDDEKTLTLGDRLLKYETNDDFLSSLKTA